MQPTIIPSTAEANARNIQKIFLIGLGGRIVFQPYIRNIKLVSFLFLIRMVPCDTLLRYKQEDQHDITAV